VLPAKDFGGLFVSVSVLQYHVSVTFRQDVKYNNVALVLSDPLEACNPLDKSYDGQFVLAIRG